MNALTSLCRGISISLVVAGLATSPPARAASPISAALQPYVDRSEVAGAVTLVATKDKVLSVEAVGLADIAAGKPMRTDAVFWIASQSKPITAAALMMLVDEGSVNLDDPVENYLAEFAGQMVVQERDSDRAVLKKPAHPITLRNVLAHTSGLPFQSPLEDPTLDRFPLEARVRSYAMLPLDFEPDSAYQYSNAGINTAARIVEVTSGMPFEQFLTERLFKPLGMTDTTFWPTAKQAARIPTGYAPGADQQGLAPTTIGQMHYPLTDRAERFPMPAGGLFSTARDIARFYQMLLNGGEFNGARLLSEESVKQITTVQTPPDLGESYGLGMVISGDSFGHPGAFSTNTVADPQRGLILVWLVQHDGFPGDGEQARDAFEQAAIEAFAPTDEQ